MQKKKAFCKFPFLLFSLLFVFGQKVMAQDEIDFTGYANVWYTIETVNGVGGKVGALASNTGLKTYSNKKDFKQTVQTGSFMGANIFVFYLFAQVDTANGYLFAGWYADDGDGKFDIQKDEFLSNNIEYTMVFPISEDLTIYDTQAAAKAAAQPSASMGTIFALFTRGATIGLSAHQNADWGNCGTLYIDKPVNEPGDNVTARALPNDGFTFLYWKDSAEPGEGEIISTDNPYTFTVEGGEKLYAYFKSDEAPSFDLPEDGGYLMVKIDRNWILSDESLKNGAAILTLSPADLVLKDGKAYLDTDRLDAETGEAMAWSKVSHSRSDVPTLISGSGTVDFAFNWGYDYGRQEGSLVKWSTNKGIEVKGNGEPVYVYVFSNDLGAFVQYGNTDKMVNPNAPSSVKVPANYAYFSMTAYDLADSSGNIPKAIGLSPESYDNAIAGISPTQLTPINVKGTKMYSLSGVEVQTTSQKGVFIVNGKKIVIK